MKNTYTIFWEEASGHWCAVVECEPEKLSEAFWAAEQFGPCETREDAELAYMQASLEGQAP